MRIDILTLFPDMVDGILSESVVGRGRSAGLFTVRCHQIRDFAQNKHNNVDDTPYGGGMGMVMQVQPVYDCYMSLCEELGKRPHLVFMSPQGKVLTQQRVRELAELDNLAILCGHYEGVDQRVIDLFIDEEISIGDYVLTGGELPAMVLTDCVSRYVDGVINISSLVDESFSDNLLEYPQYTRPQEYKGLCVPEVLRSGDHAKVDKWRREQALETTKKLRPDLLKK